MTHPLGTARASPLMLPPPSVSSPSLLGIPAHIRQRVYRFLRVAPWDGRPYKFNLHAGWLKLSYGRGVWDGHDYTAPDPSCFHGLLLSCRTIHAEAATLPYYTRLTSLSFTTSTPCQTRLHYYRSVHYTLYTTSPRYHLDPFQTSRLF
jgi:hypothetical protein